MANQPIQPSQPQGIGGVLDTAFQLYKSSFGAVWPIALLVAVISLLPSVYFLFSMSTLDPQAVAAGDLSMMYTVLVLVLITVVPSIVSAGALLLKQHAIGVDEPMGTGEAFRIALSRFLPVFGASIVYFLAVLIGSLLLLVPGIILMLSLLLYMQLVLLEGKGPIEALTGSHKLIWGNWWRTAALLTVTAILVIVIFFALGFVIALIAPFVGVLTDALVGTMLVQLVLNGVANVFITPFTTAVMISLYWDLKLRKQGGDLAARVNALSPA